MKNKFALRLRYYRDYAGETRKELGAAIGATVSAIKTWEDGTHNCSFDDLLKIAGHYGITTDYRKRSTIHTSQGELFHEILCPKSSREVPRVLETKEGHKWQQVYRN